MTGMSTGAHAEYVSVAARRGAVVPGGVSHSDAAGLLIGGSTALFFLRDKASVRPGMRVLVNGASGTLGSNAGQLARHFGVRCRRQSHEGVGVPAAARRLAVASLWDTLRARRGLVAGSAPERPADFEWLLQLVAANELTVLVDRALPLDHIGDAYRLVDSGHKRGNMIVRR